MDNQKLINQIDDELARNVDAPRAAHAQIQQVMARWRGNAKAEAAQQEPKQQNED